MKKKTTANIMKIAGATFAVCSAAAMVGAAKNSNMSAKKTVQKTADKVVQFVDTVASFMQQKSQKSADIGYQRIFDFNIPIL